MGVIRAVIAAFDERPLEENPATQRGGVLATGIDEFIQRPLAGHGNEGRAFGLGGPVQRDGQTHWLALGGQSTDPRYHAHGGHGDLVGPQRKPGRVPQDGDGLHHGVVVVQWFAHAHEDDVAQPFMPMEHRGVTRVGQGWDCGLRLVRAGSRFAQHPVHMQYLADDLPGREVSGVAALSGGAEHAAHGAADLRTHAGGGPAAVAHEHRLDDFAIGQPEQVLARESVGGAGFPDHRREVQAMVAQHPFHEARRQSVRSLELAQASLVELVPERAGMHLGEPPGLGGGLPLRAGQSQNLRRAGGRIDLSMEWGLGLGHRPRA